MVSGNGFKGCGEKVKDTEFAVSLGSLVVGVLLTAALLIYDGFWTVMIWNWFMPSFGLPKVHIAWAIGLGCVAACFRPSLSSKNEHETNGEFIARIMSKGPVIAAIAFVASHWM